MKLLSAEDVKSLPSPPWLVHTILPTSAVAVLYGPPKIGKSFVALHLAHCITNGLMFLGRRTRSLPVLYVAGEAPFGLKTRLRAWEIYYEPISDSVKYLLRPAQLHEISEVSTLAGILKRSSQTWGLLIFDTLARSFVGGDENSSQDMGRLINGCDYLRNEIGATILLVHHVARPDEKGREHERGSTALAGAADTMIRVKGSPGDPKMSLICDFQKDAEPFSDFQIVRRRVGLSCVITEEDP